MARGVAPVGSLWSLPVCLGKRMFVGVDLSIHELSSATPSRHCGTTLRVVSGVAPVGRFGPTDVPAAQEVRGEETLGARTSSAGWPRLPLWATGAAQPEEVPAGTCTLAKPSCAKAYP